MSDLDPKLKNVTIASVNGTKISEFHVASGLERAFAPHRDPKGKVRLMPREQFELRRQVIDRLITRELLFQEGKKRGVTVTDEEFANAMRVSLEEYESEEHFSAMLALHGQTMQEFKEQLQHDLVTNKVAASVIEGKRREVTEADARRYYDSHLSEMVGPEMRNILLIEVPLERYAEPDVVAAANKIIAPCAAGPDQFMAMFSAAEKPAGLTCLDLGFITRGQHHPLLDSVAFRMPVGQVSRIVKTEEGLHVLLVKSVLEAGRTWPFEEIVDTLKERIYELKSVDMVNEFVDELRRAASITVHDKATGQRLEMEEGQ